MIEKLRVLFLTCSEGLPIYGWHRVGISKRKSQSKEYNVGYVHKDFLHEWYQQPDDKGNWLVGVDVLTPEYVKRCIDIYWTYASNPLHKEAFGKAGGAYGARGRYGKSKLLDITKANWFNLGEVFVKTEKLCRAAELATSVTKIKWLIEKGGHILAPSWQVTYSGKSIDEEAIQALCLVNENPMRAADTSLVRKACFGYYDTPSNLYDSKVFFGPKVIANNDVIEQLSLAEIRAFTQTSVLPPHAYLPIRYPIVAHSAKAQVFIADMNYAFPSSETSEQLAIFVADRKCNVTPRIYSDAGTGGIDASGARSAGVAALAHDEFKSEPFSSLERLHVMSFINSDYDAWAQRVLHVAKVEDHDDRSVIYETYLTALDADLDFYHGHFTISAFQTYFAEQLQRSIDGSLSRNVYAKTHLALIVLTEATPEPAAPAIPASPRPPFIATDRVAPIEEFEAALAADTGAGVGTSATPIESDPADEEPTISEPRHHHFAVMWRYGGHFISSMLLAKHDNCESVERAYGVSKYVMDMDGTPQEPQVAGTSTADRAPWKSFDRMNQFV